MRIAIAGGGIAGLTTALAIEKLRPGVEVLLLERAPALTPVGAGVVLWPNAVSLLERLGIDLGPASGTSALSGIRAASGRWLAKVPQDTFAARIGDIRALHRADLVEALRSALTSTDVRLGCTVRSATPSGELTWDADGATHHMMADVIVAADGLRSAIRAGLWDADPMPSGIMCSRAVLDVTSEAFIETWGRGALAGIVPIGDRTYLYLAHRQPWDGRDLSWLATWPDPLPQLADLIEPGSLITGELASLRPLSSWVRGRVALAGDAAHAMLPFLGQGACQGIEDAYALARNLDNLAGYERARIRRATAVQRASLNASRVATMDGVLASARNRVLPLLPNKAFASSVARFAAPVT